MGGVCSRNCSVGVQESANRVRRLKAVRRGWRGHACSCCCGKVASRGGMLRRRCRAIRRIAAGQLPGCDERHTSSATFGTAPTRGYCRPRNGVGSAPRRRSATARMGAPRLPQARRPVQPWAMAAPRVRPPGAGLRAGSRMLVGQTRIAPVPSPSSVCSMAARLQPPALIPQIRARENRTNLSTVDSRATLTSSGALPRSDSASFTITSIPGPTPSCKLN